MTNWNNLGAIVAKEGGLEVQERQPDGTLGAPVVYRATQPILESWKFVLVYPWLTESSPFSFSPNAKENELLAAAINWLKTLTEPAVLLPSSIQLRMYSYRRASNGAWLSHFGVTCFQVNAGVIARVTCASQ